ncbi:MAG: hypothetical protein HQ557_04170 [Bacteroidetes bacterium]|nr:hypothetical protein [Bacteroidota bacterium]
MSRIYKLVIFGLIVCFAMSFLSAADAPVPDSSDPDERVWGVGLSVLSPGLPIALKGVYQKGDWGAQIEFNYFYMLGMIRLDGKRILKGSNGNDIYGFIGITGSHFNDGLMQVDSINNSLLADFGIGAEFRFGRKRQFGLGVEGGLLVPFWSNLGLDQFDNSGLMVANAFALLWL